MFKRNNYQTYLVGKAQPIGTKLATRNHARNDFFFVEGTKFYGFDEAFTSMSYCCMPGGGYFRNDEAEKNFDQFAIFTYIL